MELIIGDKNKSSWSLRPWLVLKRAGQAFTETMIRLDTETTTAEILQHSPSARVPALMLATSSLVLATAEFRLL